MATRRAPALPRVLDGSPRLRSPFSGDLTIGSSAAGRRDESRRWTNGKSAFADCARRLVTIIERFAVSIDPSASPYQTLTTTCFATGGGMLIFQHRRSTKALRPDPPMHRS